MSNHKLSKFLRSLSYCRKEGRILSCHSCCLATAAASPKPRDVNEKNEQTKPYLSIPGPFLLPFIGSVYKAPEYMDESWPERMNKSFQTYGHIYKEQIGSYKFVFTNSSDNVEKLHRQEGKYPRRMVIYPWKVWRDEHNQPSGVLTDNGPGWRQSRTILDKPMMKPQHVASYTDNFNKVITDLIERFKYIRKSQSTGPIIPNIDQELFHWSLETIGTVLYETRFGGLAESRAPEATQFINAIQELFVATNKLNFFPHVLNRIILRKWQTSHDKSLEIIYEMAHKLIDDKLDEIQNKLNEGEEVSGFLPYLLAANMSKKEIYANITDIMLGAVDTTSNTMQWVLYELARNPDLQERLHSEVIHVTPIGKIPSYENLQEMPLLKAIIKETLRLYPITVLTSRILNEEIILSGYRIPAEAVVIGALYSMGRDPNLFPEPLAFRPERWLRKETKDDNTESVHSFAWLAFGFGPRSCIGRRIAELEMYLLLARISQTFNLTPVDDEKRKPVVRGLLLPDKPVLLNFNDRK